MTVEPMPSVEASPPAVKAPYDGRLRFFRALIFPFIDKPWHWLFNVGLIVLVQYVPFIGAFVAEGWAKEVARRVRDGEPHPLPRWPTVWGYVKGLGGCLVTGFFLWAVWLAYQIPGFILSLILLIESIRELVDQAIEYWPKVDAFIRGLPPPPSAEAAAPLTVESIWNMALAAGIKFALKKAVILSISWSLIILAHLMWCGGMVRYLNRGSFWCFFHPFHNLWLVLWYWRTFILFLIFLFVGWALVGALEGILGAFVATAILMPLLFPIAFWFEGHLLGQIARKVATEG